MKKLALYVCEICGTQYSDQGKCARCEKMHRQKLTIAGARYLPYAQDASGMPVTITVTNGEDGKSYTYKR